MSISERLKKPLNTVFVGKSYDQMTISLLEKNRRNLQIVFFMYVFLEVVFIIMGGVIGSDMISTITGMSNSTILTCLLLFGVLNIINFFMIFVVWFCCESNYYKMLLCFNDTMIYLKKKLGE